MNSSIAMYHAFSLISVVRELSSLIATYHCDAQRRGVRIVRSSWFFPHNALDLSPGGLGPVDNRLKRGYNPKN